MDFRIFFREGERGGQPGGGEEDIEKYRREREKEGEGGRKGGERTRWRRRRPSQRIAINNAEGLQAYSGPSAI